MINLQELKQLCKDLKVIYVEDDIAIQKTMGNYLKKFFSSVVLACDGVEGLEKYNEQKFDIVITDLSMPRMNGITMLEKIKEIDENQAVLITTAHSESEYMFSAIKTGIDGYIIKPFEYSQLNHELFKIAQKLKKFKENEEYKIHLKEMVDAKTLELEENYNKTLYSMVEMIEQRDTYTAGHSKRVATYSKKIAQEMGYSKEKCEMIFQAGMLHDIGKIGTPDAVLLNPHSLDDIEYALIQKHVEVSNKLLHKIPMFKPLVEIVYSHHERYDGKGYPRGLKANDITPLARIIIIADAFDAMTTSRIYKARKSIDMALKELVDLKYKQFHPEVVDVAVIALKDIKIDESISQLPETKLEEERFAYFYKDRVANVYNQNYLDVVLMKNMDNMKFKYMDIFYLNNFSKFNKKYSWDDGDKLLNSFARCLDDYFESSLVFRVYGDDFVVMSCRKLNLDKVKILLDKIVDDVNIKYSVRSIDLSEVPIDSIIKIDKFNI